MLRRKSFQNCTFGMEINIVQTAQSTAYFQPPILNPFELKFSSLFKTGKNYKNQWKKVEILFCKFSVNEIKMNLIESQFLVNEFCFYFLKYVWMYEWVWVCACVRKWFAIFCILCVFVSLFQLSFIAPSQNVFYKFEQ